MKNPVKALGDWAEGAKWRTPAVLLAFVAWLAWSAMVLYGG
jgi:hypothetical protein